MELGVIVGEGDPDPVEVEVSELVNDCERLEVGEGEPETLGDNVPLGVDDSLAVKD